MLIAIFHIDISFYECNSLKQKRSILKPLLHRLNREFNVAVTEAGKHDLWNESVINCVTICNDRAQIERLFHTIVDFIPNQFPSIKYINSNLEWI